MIVLISPVLKGPRDQPACPIIKSAHFSLSLMRELTGIISRYSDNLSYLKNYKIPRNPFGKCIIKY